MSDLQDRLNLFKALGDNPDWQDILRDALEAEEKGREFAKGYGNDIYLGFEWHDVHTPPQTLNRLVAAKVLDISYSSRSSTHYKVRNPELVREALEKFTEPGISYKPEEVIPDDIFDVIVGYDKVKWVLKSSLATEEPVHMLLWGGPSTAKTMFLQELGRLGSGRYVLGSATTRAGLVDYLLELEPRRLIIDELEKADGRDLAALLSLMQTGIVTRLKKGMREQKVVKTSVYAGANEVARLPTELKSRFLVLHFKEYTEEEFRQICRELLNREKVGPLLRDFIVDQITPLTKDVRDAIKVARLAKSQEEVKRLVAMVWKDTKW